MSTRKSLAGLSALTRLEFRSASLDPPKLTALFILRSACLSWDIYSGLMYIQYTFCVGVSFTLAFQYLCSLFFGWRLMLDQRLMHRTSIHLFTESSRTSRRNKPYKEAAASTNIARTIVVHKHLIFTSSDERGNDAERHEDHPKASDAYGAVALDAWLWVK